MKHNVKITAILLSMFVLTQFIGLYVVNYYSIGLGGHALPFGLDQPQIENNSQYYSIFSGIIFSFVVAILIFVFLTRFKVNLILKIWFFLVVALSLSIALFSTFSPMKYALVIAGILALILALIKIFGRSMIVHNVTELLIYPGIAAVFVPILNVYTVIALLILISVYDMWAVWHSGIMQKMAKYQINQLRIFSGFFIPYVSKNIKGKISNWKKTLSKAKLDKKRIKVSVAILGGGDVVFPIITAGVMLKTLGPMSAIFVIIGATLGLSYLFFAAEKKKFYPAMPYITAGILLGIAASYLIL